MRLPAVAISAAAKQMADQDFVVVHGTMPKAPVPPAPPVVEREEATDAAEAAVCLAISQMERELRHMEVQLEAGRVESTDAATSTMDRPTPLPPPEDLHHECRTCCASCQRLLALLCYRHGGSV